MPAERVRKFAISVDPDEVVDFAESLSWFDEMFARMGLEKIGTYRFRYKDEECTISIDLNQGTDGYEVWATVQAEDDHEFRLQELVDEMDGYLVIGFTGRFSAPHTRGTGSIRR
jgi:ATP-dependent Zn protease